MTTPDLSTLDTEALETELLRRKTLEAFQRLADACHGARRNGNEIRFHYKIQTPRSGSRPEVRPIECSTLVVDAVLAHAEKLGLTVPRVVFGGFAGLGFAGLGPAIRHAYEREPERAKLAAELAAPQSTPDAGGRIVIEPRAPHARHVTVEPGAELDEMRRHATELLVQLKERTIVRPFENTAEVDPGDLPY